MKDIKYGYSGMLFRHSNWFRKIGLLETEWILNIDHYIYRQNNGHVGTYEDIIIKGKPI